MSSPATRPARGGQASKTKSTRKRSGSSGFASLFATLASFSNSSNSHSDAAASGQRAQPNAAASRYQNDSAAAPADAPRSREHRRSRRRSQSRTAMAPTHSAQQSRTALAAAAANANANTSVTASPASDSKALTRRQSTPQKQVVKHARPPSTVSTVNGGTKPNVFAFMSGEISTPPTPRPRAGPAKGLGITSARPIERSASIKQVSAPIPRRQIRIPQSASSLSSEQSDSDEDSDSTIDSSPGTPSPQQIRNLAAAQDATKSLERITGQDAVGRSIRTPDYLKQLGRNGPTTPPEAPMAPHMMKQYQQPQVYDYQQSPQGFSFSSTPGQFGQSNSFSRAYPTPPLDQPSLGGLSSSKSGASLSDLQQSELSLVREAVDGSMPGKMPEFLPRQYRALTLATIKRTEVMIDGLEAELRSLDKSVPIMQREHLTMRLTNSLVMHHRLVDTWSKVSQLSPLKMTGVDKEKIKAGWLQLRQQYPHLPHINGTGADQFISNVVNDLVHVGEHAHSDEEGATGSPAARTQDLRVVMIILGIVLTFLLLKDEAFQKVAIVAGVVLGIYAFTQTNVQAQVLRTKVDATANRDSDS